jgi:multidrug efflux system outer membrane protein
MIRAWRHIAIAMATALTAGCAMGPDYERPEVPVPEGYEQQAVPGESMANLDWWELFDDPILVDLIRAALLNNKEMTIAAARIVEARAALGFVRADQYPNVDGTAQGVRGNILPGIPCGASCAAPPSPPGPSYWPPRTHARQ